MIDPKLAEAYGWILSEHQPDKNFVRFRKGEKYFDIWHTGTVRYIERPQGKTEYFRDEDPEDLLKKLGDENY